jgi:hypothetical protein
MDNLNVIVGPTKELPDDFYKRLSNFYISQRKTEKVSHIWNDIFNMFHKNMDEALLSADTKAISDQLAKLYEGMTVFGVDLAIDMMKNLETYKKIWAKAIKATANNLAVLPVENPEQPVDYNFDLETVIVDIEKELGIRLSRMGGGEMFGVQLNGRFMPHHLIEAAGIGGSIKRYYSNPVRILEIGSGVGNLCLVLSEMFSCHYHIIDLPIMSVIQAYLLAIHFLPDTIWLEGEPFSNTHTAKIFIHGLNQSAFFQEQRFHFVINQDSLPEMPLSVAIDYMKMISRQLLPGLCFLSINHESSRGGQINAHKLFNNEQFSLAYRVPYWGREGYVEELYRNNG